MKIEDDAMGKLLLERGLIAPDEYHEAESLRKSTGKPLSAPPPPVERSISMALETPDMEPKSLRNTPINSCWE